MRKFKFRFDKLLMIKEQAEQEAKLRYAAVLQKRVELDSENARMAGTIVNIIEAGGTDVHKGSLLNAGSLIYYDEYINGLKTKMKMNNAKKRDINDELEGLQKELTVAMQEKKVIEKLKEKDYEKYKKDSLKHEIKVLDEIAGHMKLRK